MLTFLFVGVILCVAVLWVIRDRRTATGVPLVLVLVALVLLTIWGYGREPTYVQIGAEPIGPGHLSNLVAKGVDVSQSKVRRPTLITSRVSGLDILFGNPFMSLTIQEVELPYKGTKHGSVSNGTIRRDLH